MVVIKCPCCGAQIELSVTQAFEPIRAPRPKPKAKRNHSLSPRQQRISDDSYTSGPIKGNDYVESLANPHYPPWEDEPD